MQVRVEVKTGDVVLLEMGASEVCMYMGIVGQKFWVEVLKNGAQLYRDGRPYCIPITHGEAGIYTTSDNRRYTYREIPDASTTPPKPISRDDMPPLIGEAVRVKGDNPHAGNFGIDFADQNNVFNTTQEIMPFDDVVSAFANYPDNLWPLGYSIPASR